MPFLESPELTSSSCNKMLEIPNAQPKFRKLQIELAVTLDAMQPFVKATYTLEGDGTLALKAYGRLDALYQSVVLEHYPNVTAKAKQLSGGNTVHEQQLITFAKECVKPAYHYFKQKFDNDLQHLIGAFKGAQFFSPSRISALQPTTTDIDTLCCFPFFDTSKVDELKSELPYFMAAAGGVSSVVNVLEWWKGHEQELPHWAAAFKLIALVQPSSAACERVFFPSGELLYTVISHASVQSQMFCTLNFF